VLLTGNETEAIAILRMLDCGGNTAYDRINNRLDDPIRSVELVKEIILLDIDGARVRLSKIFEDESFVDDLLKRTHCQPPENFFIASQDMIGKSGVWSHFGSWNFDKAWIWINIRKKSLQEGTQMLIDKFNMTGDEASEIYYEIQSLEGGRDANDWISPWPSYMSGLSSCKQSGPQLTPVFTCSNGAIINMTDLEDIHVSIQTNQGTVSPSAFVYPVASGIRKVEFDDKNMAPYAVALIAENNGYRSVIMDKALADSMFTRMFFYSGQGLEYFSLFDFRTSFTGDNIFVYKVDWDGKNFSTIPDGKEVSARHILVTNETLADEIYQKIISGESFEDLAMNYSIDGSSIRGGDLGYFKTGVMVPVFEDAVSRLSVGEVSQPIKSQFGWHIVRVDDIRDLDDSDEADMSFEVDLIEGNTVINLTDAAAKSNVSAASNGSNDTSADPAEIIIT